jgi:type I restriction enzyme, S subunit
MSLSWRSVPLGKVLQQRKEFITIDDLESYKRPRVQLHAQGVVLRDIVQGAEIKTKEQQVCRAGDFLVAEIDAKVGGYGLVSAELEGAIVSSHYFLFEVDEAKLDRRFLAWYVRTPAFADQITAKGSTNYAAIRPADVLRYSIPLPSLDEQRRIVARIEELAARIEEARGLRREVAKEADDLCRSFLFNSRAVPTPMEDIVRLRNPDVEVRGDETYPFAGVYCFGGGMFRGERRSGMETAYTRLTRVRAGDFVYPKLMAWEGALAIVPAECNGMVVSPEFPVFEIIRERVLPETLDVYFRTPTVWPLLASISTGTNVRRRRLHPSAFLTYRMPLPSVPVQEQLREVYHKVGALKRLQVETAAELDALLPSVLDRAFRGEL